jgi:photosystem II stability/assembly factor-like uncharacterized protein
MCFGMVRRCLAGLVWAAVAGSAQGAAPVDALQRPALAVRQPERAVYLAAARAGQRLVAVGERGLIAVSDDDGAHWRQVLAPVSATLTGIQFVSPKIGWAIGHYGVVLHTSDAGETWVRQLDGRAAAELMLGAARRRSETDPESKAAKNALRNAEQLAADGPDKPLLDLHFRDERTGLVVGAYNLALRTEDGGRSWQALSDRIDNPNAYHLYAIAAQGSTLYLAGERGVLFRSDDGGRNFERLGLPYDGSLFTVVAPTAESVLVAGLKGNAWRSTDRGRSWRQMTGAPPLSFLASPSAQGGTEPLLLNQAGQIFRLRGDELQRVALPASPPVAGALQLRPDRWLMLSLQGLLSLTTEPPK